jgi:hypothetical protein
VKSISLLLAGARERALSAELRRDHECGRIRQRSMSRILARLD